jgi:GNAT superfamily N-acetyltransferase
MNGRSATGRGSVADTVGVSEVALRAGRPEDADVLYAIHRESVLVAYAHIFPPDRYAFPDAEMKAHWVEQLRGDEATTVVAERGRLEVGFVVVSPGWLRNLFVLPGEWSRGAGSALHDEAVRLLRLLGDGAQLWVLEANERARAFYEHRGWRADGGRRRAEYPPYPATLRYALELGAASDPSQTPTHPRGSRRP